MDCGTPATRCMRGVLAIRVFHCCGLSRLLCRAVMWAPSRRVPVQLHMRRACVWVDGLTPAHCRS